MYANRQRRRLWSSWPSRWHVVSSVADILIAATFAVDGLCMTPLPLLTVVGTLVASIVFAFAVDAVKGPVFRRLETQHARYRPIRQRHQTGALQLSKTGIRGKYLGGG
jgi:hypothetical protein